MSKILLIVSDWQGEMIWPGGIASYVDSLPQAFINLGETVKLLAVLRPNEEEPHRFLEKHEPSVIRFLVAHDKKPANWLGRKIVSALEILRCSSPNLRRIMERTPLFKSSVDSIKRLEKLLSEEGPDAVIFGHFDVKLYSLALCLSEKKLPYVIIAHGCEICPLPHSARNDLALRSTMLRGASLIAANSRHTKSLMEVWKIPPERIRVIYPPISQDAINESGDFNSTMRAADRFTIVSICRLVRGKGIDLVMRALKILGARGIPYQYFIGGDGPEREYLETMAVTLGISGQVHFMGSVVGQEKWHLLRTADVFVTPSRIDPPARWQESFGIAFVEAAAFGLPAVASTSGGIPEAVVDGDTGILVPEESPQGIADALTLLYRNPDIRLRMGNAGRERARSQFSPEAIAANFRNEFAKAARS